MTSILNSLAVGWAVAAAVAIAAGGGVLLACPMIALATVCFEVAALADEDEDEAEWEEIEE